MNTKIQNTADLKNIDVEILDFTTFLNDIDAIDPNDDQLLFKFCLFNKDLMLWPYMFNKLVSREEFKEFKNAEE